MNKIKNVKFIVAISCAGGGCVIKVLNGSEYIQEDVSEYGNNLDDLFYEGSEIPKEAGVYVFDGAAYVCSDIDPPHSYRGKFSKLYD